VQAFISKYGLAAHLAILAVAPLFLLPFCGEVWIGRTILWLSLTAALWILLEPSRRRDEMLHDARERVAVSIARDPLFWLMLLVVAVSSVRWANSGVAMAYDAENAVWLIKPPEFRFLPGGTDGSGFLPFACAVALTVLVQGCRHALGKSARIGFLFISSALAGLASFIAVVAMTAFGHDELHKAVACDFRSASFVGVAFGVYFVAATAALVGAFELKWNKAIPLVFLSIGGCGLGLFAFAPAYATAFFSAAAILALVPGLAYIAQKAGKTAAPKVLVFFGIAVTIGTFATVWLMPKEVLVGRAGAFSGAGFFSEDFAAQREVLTQIAQGVWKNHPWLGTGLDSFPLDIRFNASESDWDLLPSGQAGALNGWWQLLAERGIVGLAFLVIPVLFLLWTWGFRLTGVIRKDVVHRHLRTLLSVHPTCLTGILALAAAAACGFIDHSFETPAVLMAVGSVLALSGSALPVPEKPRENTESTEM
jgi:hypothetical protein